VNIDTQRSADRFLEAAGSRLDGSPLAVMLDIDGTLAPIASQPDAAAVPAETLSALSRLAGAASVHLAVVSGRAVVDAFRMVPIATTWTIGNHGVECRPPSGETQVLDSARPYASVVAEAVTALTPGVRAVRGAILEDKHWTLSLHYRLVEPGAVPALEASARDIAAKLGLRVTEGKKVLELRPPIDVNKGTAALDFARRIGAFEGDGAMLYAGDDRTDEDAFRALRPHDRAITVRVMGAADDPLRISTSAELAIDSTEELQRVLLWLADRRAR
jgi:trehalose-phosphatase